MLDLSSQGAALGSWSDLFACNTQAQKMQVTVLNPLNQWLTVWKSFSGRIKTLENYRLGRLVMA